MAFNLKAVFSADTKDIKKGSKEAQESVKAFEKTTEGAIDSVAGLFGTSMSQISSQVNALKWYFLALNRGIDGSAKAISGLSKAMTVLKRAIISTGIGALVVAIGSLVVAIRSLIAYFTKTQRGADMLSKAMDVVGQVFKTITDYAIKLGEKIVTAVTNPLDSIKALGRMLKKELFDRIEGIRGIFVNLGAVMSNVLSGKFKEAGEAAKAFAESVGQAMTGMTEDEIKNLNKAGGAVLDDFNEKIQRRKALTEKTQELERKRIKFISEEAALEAKINQLREKVEDRLKYSAEQRLAYEKEAIALTTQLYNKKKSIAIEQFEIIKEENALSESMNEDLEAQEQAQANIYALESQRSTQMKEMLTKQAELTNQVKLEREERERIAQLAARKEVELTIPQVSDQAIRDKIPNQVFTMTPVIDKKKLLTDMQELRDSLRPVAEEFTYDIESTVEGLVSGIAQSMGEMLAGLITGDAKISDLLGSIAALLGQAMQQIGAALVAYGVAMDAFKKAFKNPYAAIAAGVALQAAGAMLTSLIQNSMNNAGGATSIGANAGLIGAGSTLTIGQNSTLSNTQSQINVNVSGTLKARGSDLVAVIEGEDKRKGLSS